MMGRLILGFIKLIALGIVLLIVVAIIAIISAIAVPNFRAAHHYPQMAHRVEDVNVNNTGVSVSEKGSEVKIAPSGAMRIRSGNNMVELAPGSMNVSPHVISRMALFPRVFLVLFVFLLALLGLAFLRRVSRRPAPFASGDAELAGYRQLWTQMDRVEARIMSLETRLMRGAEID